MEYYSAIKSNAFESILMKWINLEPIIQSEVSQKERHKYRILTHIYRIQKNGTEEFIFWAAMEKETQRIDLWTWGEGEMYEKSNMKTYITICKIGSQWEFAVWLRKLKQGLCMNLEGWDEKGDGREVQKGGYVSIPMADLY